MLLCHFLRQHGLDDRRTNVCTIGKLQQHAPYAPATAYHQTEQEDTL
jgi:hypothetical protein